MEPPLSLLPPFPSPHPTLSPHLKTPNPKKRKRRNKPNPTQRNPNDSTHLQLQIVPVAPPRKRNPSPGLRIRGCRIYDSVNGTTCHQCRQKTMDTVVSCKNQEYENGSCGRSFCFRCVLNRYGEVAEELNQLDDWKCPKCRGVCNCSFCMRERGHQPIGMLLRTARATGCLQALETLAICGPENVRPLRIKAPIRKEKASFEKAEPNHQFKSLASLSSGKRKKVTSDGKRKKEHSGKRKKVLSDGKRKKEHCGDYWMGEPSEVTLMEFKRKVLGKRKKEFNRSLIKKKTKKAHRNSDMYLNLVVNKENMNGMLDCDDVPLNIVVNEESVNGMVDCQEVLLKEVPLNTVVNEESVNGMVDCQEVPLNIVLNEESVNEMVDCQEVPLNIVVNEDSVNGMVDCQEVPLNIVLNDKSVVNNESVNEMVGEEVPLNIEESVNGMVGCEEVPLNIVVNEKNANRMVDCEKDPLKEVPLNLVLDEEYPNRMVGCEQASKVKGVRLEKIARSRRIRLKNLARAKRCINMLDNGVETKKMSETAQFNELHLNVGENKKVKTSELVTEAGIVEKTNEWVVMQVNEATETNDWVAVENEEDKTSEGVVTEANEKENEANIVEKTNEWVIMHVNEATETNDWVAVENEEDKTSEGVVTEANKKEKTKELMGMNKELNLNELLVTVNVEEYINERISEEELPKTRPIKLNSFSSAVKSELNANELLVTTDEEDNIDKWVGDSEEFPQMRQIKLNKSSSTENSVNVLDSGTGAERGARKADLNSLSHVNLPESEKEEMIRLINSVNRNMALKEKQERDALLNSSKKPLVIKEVKLNKLEWAKNSMECQESIQRITNTAHSEERTEFHPIRIVNPFATVDYAIMNGRVVGGEKMRDINQNQLKNMQLPQRSTNVCGIGAQAKNNMEVPDISVASSSNGTGTIEERIKERIGCGQMKPKKSWGIKNAVLDVPNV